MVTFQLSQKHLIKTKRNTNYFFSLKNEHKIHWFMWNIRVDLPNLVVPLFLDPSNPKCLLGDPYSWGSWRLSSDYSPPPRRWETGWLNSLMIGTGECYCIMIDLHPQGFSKQKVCFLLARCGLCERDKSGWVPTGSSPLGLPTRVKLPQQQEAAGEHWGLRNESQVTTQNKGGRNHVKGVSWQSCKGVSKEFPESALQEKESTLSIARHKQR